MEENNEIKKLQNRLSYLRTVERLYETDKFIFGYVRDRDKKRLEEKSDTLNASEFLALKLSVKNTSDKMLSIDDKLTEIKKEMYDIEFLLAEKGVRVRIRKTISEIMNEQEQGK